MTISAEDTSSALDDEMSIATLMADAIAKWEVLTGVSMDQRGFSWGELDVHQMNEMMKEAMDREPEGLTAFMMLEVFLRRFLEEKTFTAAAIIKDYAAMTEFLARAEALFAITQSDRAVSEMGFFRNKVLSGLKHYGADRDDVVELLNDNDVLPFLRRDALESLNSLKPYQFLAGGAGAGPAQVIHHVYQAWDINELLIALRDMPMNGIAVVLLRNPSNTDRSYFSFAMRNGGNVTIFTDKNKPAFPGQEDAFTARGGRGIGRSYAKRAWANHFPYQLIKTEVDDQGDIHFKPETAPVIAGKNLVPLMKISDLEPHQVIWLTMMLSLVSEKFWKQGWQAPELSYTGDMVRKKDLLVTDDTGAQLPVASGYRPVELDAVAMSDVSAEALADQVEVKQKGVNAWLVERYKDQIPAELLNLWFTSGNQVAILPVPESEIHSHFDRRDMRALIDAGTVLPGGAISVTRPDQRHTTTQIHGYKLLTFSPTDFGTEDELRKDRLFIARHNLARAVQRCADQEYERTKSEIIAWYQDALEQNIDGLINIVVTKLAGKPVMAQRRFEYANTEIADRNSSEWRYARGNHNLLGNKIIGQYRRACLITGAEAAHTRVMINPQNAADLALVTGLTVEELPEVLQNWVYDKPYVGNDLLNRVDPVESQIHDPWIKLPLSLNFYLSKRGMKTIEKKVETLLAGEADAS